MDDWTPQQLSGFLLLPFIGLFRAVSHSNEGIVLYFRVLYLIFKAVVFGYALYRLKISGKINVFSMLGILCYYFFTPYDIDAISYNTISIAMVFLIVTILLTDRGIKSDYYLCGILLAVAVLAEPFLVLLYLLGMIAVIVFKNSDRAIPILKWKNFIILTLGAGSLAVIFLIVVFSKANIGDILANIRYIFGEPDHDMTSSNTLFVLVKKVARTTTSCFIRFGNARVTAVNVLCLGFIIFGRKRKWGGYSLSIASVCLLVSCILILLANHSYGMNYIFIAFVWYCVELFLIFGISECKYIVALVICFMFAVCTNMGTNTGILSTSAAMCHFAIVSLFLLGDMQKTEKITVSINGIVLFIVLVLRLCYVWSDVISLDDFAYYIDDGPLEGTFASERVFEEYDSILRDFDSITYDEEDILFLRY